MRIFVRIEAANEDDIDGPRRRFALSHTLALRRSGLAGLQARLSALAPMATLERGYAIVRRAGDGKRISNAIDADVGTMLDIQLHQGRLRASVRDRELTEDE